MESSSQEKPITGPAIHLSEFNDSLEKKNELMKKCVQVEEKRKNLQSKSHEKVRNVLSMTSEEAKGLTYKYAQKMDARSNEMCKLAALKLDQNNASLQGLIKDLNKERKCHSESLQRLEEKLMACEDKISKKKYFANYNMARTYYPTYENETTIEIGHYLFFTIIESYSLQKNALYEKFLKDAQI